MKVHRTIEFDRLEFEALQRVAPSIGIAFPMDDIEAARLGWTSASGHTEGQKRAKALEAAKRAWPGRTLKLVCTARRERLSPEQVWNAYDSLGTLIRVLREQSDVEWWMGQQPGGTGLTEPDTPLSHLGMARVLAEARAVQRENARDALRVLAKAVTLVGSRPDEGGAE